VLVQFLDGGGTAVLHDAAHEDDARAGAAGGASAHVDDVATRIDGRGDSRVERRAVIAAAVVPAVARAVSPGITRAVVPTIVRRVTIRAVAPVCRVDRSVGC